jgi:hypothetical protein
MAKIAFCIQPVWAVHEASVLNLRRRASQSKNYCVIKELTSPHHHIITRSSKTEHTPRPHPTITMADKENGTEVPLEEDEDWTYHPVRQLLVEKLISGEIPIDGKKLGPVHVWNKYCDMDIFEGMVYNKLFVRRLYDLRRQLKRERKRADADQRAFDVHRKNHPRPALNSRGQPQWHGSEAERLLKEDLDNGVFDDQTPHWLHQLRPEYQEFELDVFRGHIHQTIKTTKFLHTLKEQDKEKAAQKAEERAKKAAKGRKK